MLTINEKVKSNFESSAEKFDRIYDPSEKNLYLVDGWISSSVKPCTFDLKKP